jgi:RNA polymerase sigma-70 factor (ECF subfamily)
MATELHSTSTGAAPKAQDLFVTTKWTLVLAASRPHSPQAARALEELCQTYWYALYAYVRHHGHSKEDAEDLVQGFFSRFLDKNSLAGLSRDRGKFRAFLLVSLKHYVANEWDRARTVKRGGTVQLLSLDWVDAEARYQIEPTERLSPDKLFDRAWAVALLERVLAQLRQESGAVLFEHLKPFVSIGKGAVPYRQAAIALGMSEAATRVAVHRLRRRYRELLREEVAQTLTHPDQIEEEMRALLGAFGA